MPISWYVDPAHFERERTAIFGQEWLFATSSSRLIKPGDYVTISIMGYEVVVIKQNDGSIKAFRNVCRHRASQLLSGSGTCKGNCITCPYHAWTFEIDGSLRKAPKFDDLEDFCRNDYPLYSVTLRESDGLIFFNMGNDMMSLDNRRVERLHQVLSEYPLNQYSYHSSKTFEISCNWKTWIENYQECYHCRTLHPLLHRNYDLNKYELVNADGISHHKCPRKSIPVESTRPGDVELQARDGFWVFIWPNLALGLYDTYYDTLEAIPINPDKTKLVMTVYGRNNLSKEELNCNIEAVSFQTYYEDIAGCELVHKGLVATQDINRPVGPLHPDRESGVIYFDSLVRVAIENSCHSNGPLESKRSPQDAPASAGPPKTGIKVE